MLIDALASYREVRTRQVVPDFPLEPIDDEHSYRRAIEILDRLFLLHREKTHDENEYFRALAQMAYEYECSHL
jgi:antitoxin component HigA of HigAB toxin-antitoxin module